MILKDEVYEALDDVEVTCMVAFRAPFTGGYSRTLPKGQLFRITHSPLERSTAVYAEALRYREIELLMVPRRDRWRWLLYAGFYLCVPIVTIEEKCLRVPDPNQRMHGSHVVSP